MSISLDEIVEVNVSLTTTSPVNAAFNVGLLISANSAITTEDRIKSFSSLKEVIDGGFKEATPEYKAAQAYFGQTIKPKQLLIGAKGADETYIVAFNACREANTEWYGCALIGEDVTDTIIKEVAESAMAQEYPSILVFQTQDEKCLEEKDTTSIFSVLHAANNGAAIGIYSKDPLAASALLGMMMGYNSLDPNAAYTLAYKKLNSITAEPMSSAQFKALKNHGGNAVVNFAGKYSVLVQGVMCSGQHYDVVYCLDALRALVQQNVVGLLINSKKIAQTDDGMLQIVSRIVSACEKLRLAGYIAPGVWNGETILELQTGDALPSGYMILFQSVTEQDQSEREQRVTPPIYAAIKLAGAVEHVVVAINVNM